MRYVTSGFMLQGSRIQLAAPTAYDARERILAAAERCIERYGIRKTTMDDIASAVGLSRPSVYRYFADRDDLLIELITRHARVLTGRAHESMSRQDGFSAQIIEGILYIAEYGRRDPLTRHVVDPDGTNLGRRMIASGTSKLLRADLFDPYLDAAVAEGALPSRLPRADFHLWFGNLATMVMRGLEDGEGTLRRYRWILHRFVAPAFAATSGR